MSNDDAESFLGRWARLKQRSREEASAGSGAHTPAVGQDSGGDGGDPRPGPADDGGVQQRDGVDPHDATRTLGQEDFSDVDFEALDINSDYTRFMGRNVPDNIRNQALSKLWTSDPLFANLDGLDDYIDDYTDAAVAVPVGALKTAYKIGQGFLSNEEAAVWDRLGKPEAEVGARSAEGQDVEGPGETTEMVSEGDATGAQLEAAASVGDGVTSPAEVAAAAADAWSRRTADDSV